LQRVARDIVQDEEQMIESHHLMQPVGQVMAQRTQVTVSDNGFGNREQGAVLLTLNSDLLPTSA
jgi:hypothetical protein